MSEDPKGQILAELEEANETARDCLQRLLSLLIGLSNPKHPRCSVESIRNDVKALCKGYVMACFWCTRRWEFNWLYDAPVEVFGLAATNYHSATETVVDEVVREIARTLDLDFDFCDSQWAEGVAQKVTKESLSAIAEAAYLRNQSPGPDSWDLTPLNVRQLYWLGAAIDTEFSRAILAITGAEEFAQRMFSEGKQRPAPTAARQSRYRPPPCPACGESATEVASTRPQVRWLKCRNCEHNWVRTRKES